MNVQKCPQCASEELVENNIPHVLLEQGHVTTRNNQNGIEVFPTICMKCGFVMLFRK
jgi:predicted Zn-ribbon and HTH transcriptional regulator